MPPPKQKKSLPKASPAVMRSKSKKQKTVGRSFKASVKEGAKAGIKKGVQQALKSWVDWDSSGSSFVNGEKKKSSNWNSTKAGGKDQI